MALGEPALDHPIVEEHQRCVAGVFEGSAGTIPSDITVSAPLRALNTRIKASPDVGDQCPSLYSAVQITLPPPCPYELTSVGLRHRRGRRAPCSSE